MYSNPLVLISCFLVFLFRVEAYTQNAIKLIDRTTQNSAIFVGVDAYNNNYKIVDNTFLKLSDNTTYRYKNFALGHIHSSYITNPLQPLLFYENTQHAVLLDNRLNETNLLNFNTVLPNTQLQFLTYADSQSVWLIDRITHSLWRYNHQTQTVVFKTAPFQDTIRFMQGNFNYCLVQTTSTVFLFSYYGNLITQYPIQKGTRFWLQGEELIEITETSIIIHNLSSTQKRIEYNKPEPCSANPLENLQLTEELLYIYDGQFLCTYNRKPTN